LIATLLLALAAVSRIVSSFSILDSIAVRTISSTSISIISPDAAEVIVDCRVAKSVTV